LTETAIARRRLPKWVRFGLWLISCAVVFWLLTMVLLFAELPSNPVREFLLQFNGLIVIPILFFITALGPAYIWYRLQILEGDGPVVGMVFGFVASAFALFGAYVLLAIIGAIVQSRQPW